MTPGSEAARHELALNEIDRSLNDYERSQDSESENDAPIAVSNAFSVLEDDESSGEQDIIEEKNNANDQEFNRKKRSHKRKKKGKKKKSSQDQAQDKAQDRNQDQTQDQTQDQSFDRDNSNDQTGSKDLNQADKEGRDYSVAQPNKLKNDHLSEPLNGSGNGVPIDNFKFRSFVRDSMDPQFLDGRFEIQKMFGRRVIDSAEKKSSSTQQRGLSRHTVSRLTRSLLCSWKDNWPLVNDTYLDVERCDQPARHRSLLFDERYGKNDGQQKLAAADSLSTFRFSHSRNYQSTFRTFLEAVQTNDVNSTLALAAQAPFCVELALQISEVLEFHGSHEEALDAVERAVWALGSHLPPSFLPRRSKDRYEQGRKTVHSGKERNESARAPLPILPVNYPENRSFFRAIFMYIKHLRKQGCYRTALEYTKLMIVLQDEDYLSSLLFIDALALKSHCDAFLCDLADLFSAAEEGHRYPNIFFSAGIAQWRLDGSKNRLKKACQMYPRFSQALLADIIDSENRTAGNTAAGASDGVRRSFPSDSFFRKQPDEPCGDVLRLILAIYEENTREIWTQSEHKQLLLEVAKTIRTEEGVSASELATEHVRTAGTAEGIARYVMTTESVVLRGLLPGNLVPERQQYPWDILPPIRTSESRYYSDLIQFTAYDPIDAEISEKNAVLLEDGFPPEQLLTRSQFLEMLRKADTTPSMEDKSNRNDGEAVHDHDHEQNQDQGQGQGVFGMLRSMLGSMLGFRF